jgi:6-phosphogluconolactonase
MEIKETPFGLVHIFDRQSQIFEAAFSCITQSVELNSTRKELIRVGLSGGSTPQAWYKWIIQSNMLTPELIERIIWTTSDERCVPLESPKSNFGNAMREFLNPSKVPTSRRFPWPIHLQPQAAANAFNRSWISHFGEGAGLDVCFLGLGDDGHTASLWPGCELLDIKAISDFASTNWPEKGWRLTITPEGLAKAKQIVVIVIGENKAQVLKDILKGPYDSKKYPAQILKTLAERVFWLTDREASHLISNS